ncbi:hypothetical protein DKX38_005331 [Salix brachista]|uniref:Cytochrome b561 domain-containing protein n=1 Tax=Salix brachista TaxID=2182728 RepID=A0A5N5MZG2_9ROSI|nr:hypothetical protein DKX38_005331 [Salix brachista]
MSSHRLLILCLILCVQNYSCSEGSLVTAVRRSNDLRGSENAETTNLRSWNGQIALHRRSHLGNTHGVLNIIGWGTLLPIGAIVARSFRKSPLKCDEWQAPDLQSPVIILINLALLISDAIVSVMQMFALCLQPKKENERRRWWKICHKILGYLLISMIVANIFQGIGHKDHAEKWKWIYVGILSVLSFCALVLEIFRFVMPRIHR